MFILFIQHFIFLKMLLQFQIIQFYSLSLPRLKSLYQGKNKNIIAIWGRLIHFKDVKVQIIIKESRIGEILHCLLFQGNQNPSFFLSYCSWFFSRQLVRTLMRWSISDYVNKQVLYWKINFFFSGYVTENAYKSFICSLWPFIVSFLDEPLSLFGTCNVKTWSRRSGWQLLHLV